MYSRRGKRRLFLAYLLGVVSVLVVEGVVAGISAWPPSDSVAGTPHPMAQPNPVARTEQATVPPATEQPGQAPVSPPAPPQPQTSAPGLPAQPPGTVRLPAGGLAHLVRQDVENGVLPVPPHLDQAAWWGADLDAQRGASVLAGHVNWQGQTGPFAELWTARIGQEVTVTDFAGKTSVYRISQLFSLKKNELPQRAADLFAQTGAHRIVLVTCGGEWVGGAQGYAENRVVIADPE